MAICHDFRCYLSVATIAFAIPSWFLYLSVLIVIYKHRKVDFKGPFYRTCLHMGICDMAWGAFLMYGVILSNILPATPMVVDIYNSIHTILVLCFSTFMYGQLVGLLVLALNRFTALVYPLRHASVSSRAFSSRQYLCLLA